MEENRTIRKSEDHRIYNDGIYCSQCKILFKDSDEAWEHVLEKRQRPRVTVLMCSNPGHQVFRYCPSPTECAKDYEMREAT